MMIFVHYFAYFKEHLFPGVYYMFSLCEGSDLFLVVGFGILVPGFAICSSFLGVRDSPLLWYVGAGVQEFF